jgi:hypothetical protein
LCRQIGCAVDQRPHVMIPSSPAACRDLVRFMSRDYASNS